MLFYLKDFIKNFNSFRYPINKFKFNFFQKKKINKAILKSKKKILLLVNHEETLTGAPKLFLQIGKELKKDFFIIVISLRKGSLHKEFKSTFEFIIYPGDLFFVPSSYRSITNLLKFLKPNFLYGSTLVTNRYMIAGNKLNIPSVCHVHEDKSAMEFCFKGENDIKKFSQSKIKFIAVSSKVAEFIRSEFDYKLDVNIIPPFVSSENILEKSLDVSENEIKKEICKSENEFLLVSVGSIHNNFGLKRKGFDLLLEAFGILNKRGNCNLKLLWIGKYKKSLVKFIEQKYPEIKKRILMLGEKENPFPFIRASDIFVLPSRHDPFPLALIEALVLNKPIIAFQGSGGADEIVNNNNGILVSQIEAEPLSLSIERAFKNLDSFNYSLEYEKEFLKSFEKENAIKQIKNIILNM